MYIKKNFIEDLKIIKPNGFDIPHDNESIFTKEELNRKLRIDVSCRKYFPHGFYVDGVSASIYFTELEDVLNLYLDKYKIEQRYGDTTIQKSLVGISKVDYSKFAIEICNDKTFNEVATEVNKIIEYGVSPFFERYKTLNAISDDLSKMNEDEISNFISGIVRLKTPLIKKLVDADDYFESLKVSKEFYQGEALKYPQYFKGHDKVFFDLFSEDLKNIKPIA